MSKPLFSVCVIAKNEKENLVHFFEGLKGFMDAGGDVQFLDTGSTDGTDGLAEKLGARVHRVGSMFMFEVDREIARQINKAFVEPGDAPVILTGQKLFHYGNARNYIDQFAEHDMILAIDPDEVVLKLDVDKMNEVIEAGAERISVAWSDIRTGQHYWFDDRWYDRRKYRWVGAMHEDITPIGKIGEMIRPPEWACAVEHRPIENKNREKYLAAMAFALWKQPRLRQTHWLAREMLYTGRYKSAIRLFVNHITMKDKEV
jgi:glycosyltransferase involved in cell wall biosynthesis